MALSGSYNWTLNRDEVIKAALRKIATLSSGGTPTTEQTTDAASALNGIVKLLQAEGMPLWAITSHTWTVTDGTATYTIGTGKTLNVPAPLRILQALRTPSGGSAVPMNVYTRYDFNILPNDTDIEGTPVNLYYQPTVPATDSDGTIKIWPIPNNSTDQITIHYVRPFQDLDGATDNFDFPSYYIPALTYHLAWMLSHEYGISPADRKDLAETAQFLKNEALSLGTEEGSIRFVPFRY